MELIYNTLLHLKHEGWNVEEELEELELFKNSNCENCYFSKLDKKHPKYLRCTNESDLMPYEDMAILLNVHPKFYCNQWKKKS